MLYRVRTASHQCSHPWNTIAPSLQFNFLYPLFQSDKSPYVQFGPEILCRIRGGPKVLTGGGVVAPQAPPEAGKNVNVATASALLPDWRRVLWFRV